MRGLIIAMIFCTLISGCAAPRQHKKPRGGIGISIILDKAEWELAKKDSK
jgi:uncharacterized protein YceK